MELDRVSSERVLKSITEHAQVRQELIELFDVVAERIPHVTATLEQYETVPLRVHARYTRLDILAACV